MGILLERFRQKHRTMSYPDGPAPGLPERWRGEADLNADAFKSAAGAANAADAANAANATSGAATGMAAGAAMSAAACGYCPTGALTAPDGRPVLDAGLCLFCGACAESGPKGGVAFSRRYAMARFTREGLVRSAEGVTGTSGAAGETGKSEIGEKANAARLAEIRGLFGKSLKLRQVSAGGCNACEADCNVLGTPAWDMGRFGLSFVASPRHADGILVTGPVTDNMKLALEKTYAAVAAPKVVIAVGACAVSGGIYGKGGKGGDNSGGKGKNSGRGILEQMLPVDLFIPGCPPHPLTILEGLLRFIGRVPDLR